MNAKFRSGKQHAQSTFDSVWNAQKLVRSEVNNFNIIESIFTS